MTHTRITNLTDKPIRVSYLGLTRTVLYPNKPVVVAGDIYKAFERRPSRKFMLEEAVKSGQLAVTVYNSKLEALTSASTAIQEVPKDAPAPDNQLSEPAAENKIEVDQEPVSVEAEESIVVKEEPEKEKEEEKGETKSSSKRRRRRKAPE